jgi:hypothetical protein
MKSFLAFAAIPIFAGGLFAQTASSAQTESQSTTTTTSTSGNNYNGVLVDEGCVTRNTEKKETSSNPDQSTTTTTTTTSTTSCPVTTSTTSFALQTSDGKYIHFDTPSNARIVEMVKSNEAWKKSMESREPLRVRVVGSPNGDVIVVESIR